MVHTALDIASVAGVLGGTSGNKDGHGGGCEESDFGEHCGGCKENG